MHSNKGNASACGKWFSSEVNYCKTNVGMGMVAGNVVRKEWLIFLFF